MVHAGCVFVASILPSRTWMSGSFESVQWYACVHRQDLGLYSHLKEFWWNGVRTHANSKEKSCLPENISSEEDRTHNTASSRTVSPTHYQRAIPAPNQISISQTQSPGNTRTKGMVSNGLQAQLLGRVTLYAQCSSHLPPLLVVGLVLSAMYNNARNTAPVLVSY